MPQKERPEAKSTGRIRDARGRSVNLLDPYSLHLLRRYDVIPAEPLSQIVKEIGPGMAKWRYRLYVGSVGVFFACIVFLVLWKLHRGTGVDIVERFLWPLNLGVFVFGAFVTWRGARRARLKRACAVMLKHLRCPHCGYDIRSLPSSPDDGATVCPECGCAWRLDDSQAVRGHDND